MIITKSNAPVVICAGVLGATALAKAYGLVFGGGLVDQPHPFLPGSFSRYVWAGLLLELASLAVLVLRGVRPFLSVCLGLAVVFVGYHAVEVGLRIPASCPCLGGILGSWSPLVKVESVLSFLLACALGISSFVSLFPRSPASPLGKVSRSSLYPVLFTCTLWLLAGGLVLFLWHGRILGGDEGMEAAKALQISMRPEVLGQMWNDQPPLWSTIIARLFSITGPSLTSARVVVLLVGMLIPLTGTAFACRHGMWWAGPVFVVLSWSVLSSVLGSCMLEAPAYAIGTASLLPLLWRTQNCGIIPASATIAAIALAIKLTAAFALVVPFVWLVRKSWRDAITWSGLTIGLLLMISFVQTGWSWHEMASSHLTGSEQQSEYRLDASIYVDAWFMCVLALFSLASRYLTHSLEAILPWLISAATALMIHLFHRPFWDYYGLHLLIPVAVIASVGVGDFCGVLKVTAVRPWERTALQIVLLLLCALFFWQRVDGLAIARKGATAFAESSITKQLKELGHAGHTMFAMEPTWTFAAGHVQDPPELTIIPLKRIWSGELNDAAIASLLSSNRIDALALYDTVHQASSWTNLLSDYVPTARDGHTILYLRSGIAIGRPPVNVFVDKPKRDVLKKLGF